MPWPSSRFSSLGAAGPRLQRVRAVWRRGLRSGLPPPPAPSPSRRPHRARSRRRSCGKSPPLGAGGSGEPTMRGAMSSCGSGHRGEGRVTGKPPGSLRLSERTETGSRSSASPGTTRSNITRSLSPGMGSARSRTSTTRTRACSPGSGSSTSRRSCSSTTTARWWRRFGPSSPKRRSPPASMRSSLGDGAHDSAIHHSVNSEHRPSGSRRMIHRLL